MSSNQWSATRPVWSISQAIATIAHVGLKRRFLNWISLLETSFMDFPWSLLHSLRYHNVMTAFFAATLLEGRLSEIS